MGVSGEGLSPTAVSYKRADRWSTAWRPSLLEMRDGRRAPASARPSGGDLLQQLRRAERVRPRSQALELRPRRLGLERRGGGLPLARRASESKSRFSSPPTYECDGTDNPNRAWSSRRPSLVTLRMRLPSSRATQRFLNAVPNNAAPSAPPR